MNDSRFEALLRTRIGLDPDSVGRPFIERAILQRMSDLACDSRDAYWSILASSEDEQHMLVEGVVVPETWFFRYPEALAECARTARRLSRQGAVGPVRILSLPCSTGEEPYSIAMSLFDHGFTPADFVIDALDVSAQALTRARQGRYGRNAFRTPELDFRERYFTSTAQGYDVLPMVQQSVSFRQENMFALSELTVGQPYDIVFCRNVLIYFDETAQARALTILHRLCAQHGVLFAGPAEANLLTRAGYESVGSPRAFAFSRPDRAQSDAGVPASRSPAVAEARPAWLVPPGPRAQAQLSRVAPSRYAQRAVMRRAAHAMPPAGSAPVASDRRGADRATASNGQGEHASPTGPRYAWIQSLADSGQLAQAAQAAQDAMDTDGAQAQLFYLLALCQDALGEGVQALNNYRKTLYLAPDHIPALTHLAALLEAQGDTAAASRLRRRAAREEARGD